MDVGRIEENGSGGPVQWTHGQPRKSKNKHRINVIALRCQNCGMLELVAPTESLKGGLSEPEE